MKKHLSVIILVAVLLLGVYLVGRPGKTAAPAAPKQPSQTSVQTPSPAPAATSFDKTKYSLTDPASRWVVTNKLRPLDPKTYKPQLAVPDVKLKRNASADSMHVSRLMAPALEALFKAAAGAGNPLMLSSGYRSYDYQVTVYNSEVKAYGQAKADEESARPGYSEHQTGLAADVAPADGTCDLQQCFGTTAAGKWLAAHAYQYGFVIRYPEGKQSVTGYEYEPWHIRYVGSDLAAEMHKQGVTTLEEFFGLPAAPDYRQ